MTIYKKYWQCAIKIKKKKKKKSEEALPRVGYSYCCWQISQGGERWISWYDVHASANWCQLPVIWFLTAVAKDNSSVTDSFVCSLSGRVHATLTNACQ